MRIKGVLKSVKSTSLNVKNTNQTEPNILSNKHVPRQISLQQKINFRRGLILVFRDVYVHMSIKVSL